MEWLILLGVASTMALSASVGGDTAEAGDEAEAEDDQEVTWTERHGTGKVRMELHHSKSATEESEHINLTVGPDEEGSRIWVRYHDYWAGKYDGFYTNFDVDEVQPLGEQAFDIDAGGGDDHVRVTFDTVGLAPLELVEGRIDAGDGDDLVETNAADVIYAGDGQDRIDVQGDVAVYGGAGDDLIVAGMTDQMARVTSQGSGEAEHILAQGGSGKDIFAIGRNHYWNGTLEVADFNPDEDQLVILNGFSQDYGYAPDEWGSEVVDLQHRIEDGDTILEVTNRHFNTVAGFGVPEFDEKRVVTIILRDTVVEPEVLQGASSIPEARASTM